jgi:tetratricopeptide (TPR) repeat protein
LSIYDQVLDIDAAFYRAHYNKAVIHHMLGQSASEIAEYRQAIGIKPDYTPALYNLAAALSATEDYDDAAEAWEKYIAAARNKSDEKAFVENARKEVSRLRGM